MLKHQAESEEVIRDTSHDIAKHDGNFDLVDSVIGPITKRRFPYVVDAVKLNGKRLDHMLTQCSDWSEQECVTAHKSITAGVEFSARKEGAPRRYALRFIKICSILPHFIDGRILQNT